MQNTSEIYSKQQMNVSTFLAIIGSNDLCDTAKKPLQKLGFVNNDGLPNICKLNTVFGLE